LAAARKGGGVELLVAMLIAHAYWMRIIPSIMACGTIVAMIALTRLIRLAMICTVAAMLVL
jgi:hypothetical protein